MGTNDGGSGIKSADTRPFYFEIEQQGSSSAPKKIVVDKQEDEVNKLKTEKFMLGNYEVFKDMYDKLGGKGLITLSPDRLTTLGYGKNFVPIDTYSIVKTKKLIDFDNNGVNDTLVLQSATIYVGDDRTPITHTWLVAIPETSDGGKISAEEMSNGIIIASNVTEGEGANIRGIKLIDTDGDGMADSIRFSMKHEKTWQKYFAKRSIGQKSVSDRMENYEVDIKLIESVLALHSEIGNTLGAGGASFLMNTKMNEEIDGVTKTEMALYSSILRPAYGQLKSIKLRLDRDHEMRAEYESRTPILMKKFYSLMKIAKKAMAITSSEEAKRIGSSMKNFVLATKSFVYGENGEKQGLRTDEFRALLATMENSGKLNLRAGLMNRYSFHIQKYGHVNEGGLYSLIPIRNHEAQQETDPVDPGRKFTDYADKICRQLYDQTADEISANLTKDLKKTESEFKMALLQLKEVLGLRDDQLTEADVAFAINKVILKESGLKEHPTITREQLLTGVANLLDGLELGESIGPVFIDAAPREGKYGSGATVPIKEGGFVAVNIPDQATLNDAEVVFHELMHRTHYAVGWKELGDVFITYMTSKDVKEGISDAFAYAIMQNPNALQIAFPQLDIRYTEAFAKWHKFKTMHKIRTASVESLVEIGMYREQKNGEKPHETLSRVSNLHKELIKKHLGGIVPLEYGHGMTLVHWALNPLSIAAYARGSSVFQKKFDKLIAAMATGDNAAMECAKKEILQFMADSAGIQSIEDEALTPFK